MGLFSNKARAVTVEERRPDAWHDGERELRQREVDAQERSLKVQRRAFWSQVAVTIAAVLASLAAAFAAAQAKSAVNVAEQGIQQQDAENQLSTAVTALGGTNAAQRVAGITLLERNVADQLAIATNRQGRQNAYSLYLSAVMVLANYLQSGAPHATEATCPNVTNDVTYAADELKTLLDMRRPVMSLHEGVPAVDLSRAELCGQYWKGITFNWLAAAFLWKIDLRGADLENSRWGTAYLVDAQLKCADLSGADLRHATLTGADLRGTNLVGARLPKTLQPLQLVGAVRRPTPTWSSASCLESKAYSVPLNAPATATNVQRH